MKKNLLGLLVLLLNLCASSNLQAEGTNPVSPNSSNISALLIGFDLGSGSYKDCGEDNRIYFDIKDHVAENLYFGFDWRQYTAAAGDAPRLANLYYRIRRPDGTVVAGPTLWNPTSLGIGIGGTGVIANYTRAFNGPNIGSTTTGYTPLVFDPTENGSFWIEFYRSADGGSTMLTTGTTGINGNRAIAPLFDLTVANNSTFQIYNGRVRCDKWAFLACEPSTFRNVVNADAAPIYYAYTNDSCTVKIDIQSGFKPIAFDVAVNNYGVTPITGLNPFNVSRRSTNNATSPSLLGGYHVFLNIPDPAIYPPGHIPGAPQFASPAITGCGPYLVHYITTDPGDVKILLNLNGVAGYQDGSEDRILEGFNVPAGLNTISWDGKDGLGNNVAGGTNIKITSTVLKGRFNIPLYDAEVNTGGMIVDIISPYFGRPDKIFWDDSFLSNVGATCAGTGDNANNRTGSGLDNALTGITTMPTRAWNGNGNPTNTIPAPAVSGNDANAFQCDDFGNVRTLNTWGWGLTVNSSELEVTFGCPPNTTYAINDENSTWINTPVSGNVSTNDFDPEGNTQTFGSFLNQTSFAPIASGAIVGGLNSSGGVVANAGTLSFTNGAYTFTPANGFTGVVAVPYNVCDNGTPSACDTALLIITVSPLTTTGTNSIIANDDENISYGATVTGNVTSNDVDPQGDAFSVTAVTGSTPGVSFTVSGTNLNGTPNSNAGTLVINADGTYSFTPTPGFNGSIDVPYTITDSNGATATAILHIDVLYDINGASNNPPFAGDDFAYTSLNTAVNGTFVNNDADSDGDPISLNGVTIVNGGPHTPIGAPIATSQGGTVQFYADGTYTYTPPTGYSGPDAVTYQICDVTVVAPQPLCSTATIHFLVSPGPSVSGNVYDDANGLNDALVNGTGTNAGGLNAVLVDNSGNVAAVVAVAADGTYTFNIVNPGTYSVLVTTNAATVGNPAPAVALPAGWISTGEGTAAAGDGNVNGQTNTFTVSGVNISNVNFGIDQIPTADAVNAASQVNPGGTTQVTVPTLTGSDPEDGTYDGVSGTNTIIIQTIPGNGTLYYNGVPVVAGQTISNYDPSLLTIDPNDGAITVTFTYSVVDAAGVPSPAATVNIPFGTVSVSGNVFDDANGLNDALVNGTGTNAGGLNAVLVDNSGNVAAVVAVAADGTYTFNIVNPGTYSVLITTNAATVGNPAPAVALPAGWISTGEGTTAAGDGNVNGQTNTFVVSNADVSGVNFGIDQIPTADAVNAASQVNPGGTTQVTIPTLTGSDPEDGTYTGVSGTNTIIIQTVPGNGTLYYNGVPVVAGQTISNYDPSLLTVDPNDGAITVTFTYSVVDAAGVPSPAATVNIPFGTVSVSGTIFNDVNGDTDATINGTGTNAGGLNVVLIDNNTNAVVAVQAVAADGTYTFNGVSGGNYSVLITTSSPNPGDPAPSAGLPAGWANTAEGTTAGGDGTPNGQTNVFTVAGSNVTNVNFGIEQLPTASTISAPGQTNPEGTVNVTVPATIFAGTDPDGGTITGIIITSFPTNATSITINGITYTSGTFPPGGVAVPTNTSGEPTVPITIDPVDGLVNVDIPYVVIDNAGLPSSTPGHAIVPFTSTVPVSLLDFTAVKQGTLVALNWSTAQEINASHFELERSANGGAYTMIQRIQAAGNSSTVQPYFHKDQAPVNGINAYRLKMVDRDGRFAYSPIRTVRFDKAGSLNIYPNPAKEGFTISFSSSWQGKSLVLELFDVAGKRVYREEWKQGPATVYVPTNNLQVGHYILKVQGADQNILSQLIQVIK